MRILFVTLFVVVIDQLTKVLVKGFAVPFLNIRYEGMYHGQRIPILGQFFQLTFVENPGMAFGIDLTITGKLLISVFSIIASVGLFYYLYTVRDKSLSLRLSLALILGGAIGNLIDRVFYGVFYQYAPLFYGKVVDFLDFDFFNINLFGRVYDRFPIFNIADTAVSLGVFIMLLFYKKHQDETESLNEPQTVAGESIDEVKSNLPENELSDVDGDKSVLTESSKAMADNRDNIPPVFDGNTDSSDGKNGSVDGRTDNSEKL